MRVKVFILALATAACFFAACRNSKTLRVPHVERPVRSTQVASAVLPADAVFWRSSSIVRLSFEYQNDEAQGITRYWKKAGRQEVVIDPRVHPVRRRRVVTHEMWHVFGWRTHTLGPFITSSAAPSWEPPPGAAALLRDCGSYTLVVMDERLRADAVFAAHYWNDVAGRQILTVR